MEGQQASKREERFYWAGRPASPQGQSTGWGGLAGLTALEGPAQWPDPGLRGACGDRNPSSLGTQTGALAPEVSALDQVGGSQSLGGLGRHWVVGARSLTGCHSVLSNYVLPLVSLQFSVAQSEI